MILTELEAARLIELTGSDYFAIRDDYYAAVKGDVEAYMSMDGSRVSVFQNDMRQTMVTSFSDAFDAGYADGGGELPIDDQDALGWLASKMSAEMGFIGMTFQNMKDLKASGDDAAIGSAGDDTATGYANTLDGVYNEGKLYAAGNKLLEFGGTDGKESCSTCQKLKGQQHRASWWISHGLVPGQPGNDNFECGGWLCVHFLFDPVTGQLFTV